MLIVASLLLTKLKLLTAKTVMAMMTAINMPSGVMCSLAGWVLRRFSIQYTAVNSTPYTSTSSSTASGSRPVRWGHRAQCSCHSTLAASSAKINARAQ